MQPFEIGERVQLTDAKDRKFTVTLSVNQQFHTHKGIIEHNDLIGAAEGTLVTSTKGHTYLALRPLLVDFVMSMPRGASIVYPKDSASIIAEGDIYPGATVLEAGAGSGALTCFLLRAVGEAGKVISVEVRSDHATVARKNVTTFFSGIPPQWQLLEADITQDIPELSENSCDRVVLDMLNPDAALPQVSTYLRPGGVLTCYVATVTQLSKIAEALREQGGWTAARSWEILVRGWHLEGLAVRPNHRMQAHTAFILTARLLSPGVQAPVKHLHSAKRHRMSLVSTENPSATDTISAPFDHLNSGTNQD